MIGCREGREVRNAPSRLGLETWISFSPSIVKCVVQSIRHASLSSKIQAAAADVFDRIWTSVGGAVDGLTVSGYINLISRPLFISLRFLPRTARKKAQSIYYSSFILHNHPTIAFDRNEIHSFLSTFEQDTSA